MKRLLCLAILLFGLGNIAHAQSLTRSLTAQGAECGAANASSLILNVSAGVPISQVAFALSGTFSGTVTFKTTANGGATWSAFNVTPSSGGSGVTTATAIGNWNQNAGAYTGFCVLVSTYTSGTFKATIQLSGSGSGGGGSGGSVVPGGAGDTTFYSKANAISPATVTLDMVGIAGSDLGVKMNNCVSQLPSGIGICKGDNLTGAQVLSTAVTVPAPDSVTFTFCGQAISQTAAVSGDGYSIRGCENQTTTFTKGANIDLFTLTGAQQSITNLNMAGARPTFTGDGIVLDNSLGGEEYATIRNVHITGIAGSSIHSNGGFFNYILLCEVEDYGLHGYFGENNNFDIFQSSTIQDTQISGVSTGTGLESDGPSWVLDNYISTGAAFPSILSHDGTNNAMLIRGNYIQNSGGYPAASLGLLDMFTENTEVFGGGAGQPVILGGKTITNNHLSNSGTFGGDVIDITAAGGAAGAVQIANNLIQFDTTGVSGKCGVNLNGESIGATVIGNFVIQNGASSGANSGICLTPVAATHLKNTSVAHNTISWSTGDTANGLGVKFDNTVGLVGGNAGGNQFVSNTCNDTNVCVSRIDTTNANSNFYSNNGTSGTQFDSGGSTLDVTQNDANSVTFATLPTVAGNGSRFYCTNCTQTKPTTNAGSGASVVREAGQWNGL